MLATRLSRPGLWPGRSAVLARQGLVCTSQPLASAAALDVMRRGGNALDAAITASATLAVVEPLSTGVGGDVLALYWSARERKLKGLNGTGRCPQKLTPRFFESQGLKKVPTLGWSAITVPGCVDGWRQLHQADGRLPWKDLFDAPIEYARAGFPLSEIIAGQMQNVGPSLRNDAARRIFLPNGVPVKYAQVFKQTDLARTLEQIAVGGAEAFYRGEIAEQIVKAGDAEGGFFSREDLAAHSSLWVTPLKAAFRGLEVYELPPNCQGLTAILALNVLSSLDLEKLRHDWGQLTHAVVEAVKLAMAEADAHVADPHSYSAPLTKLTSLSFAAQLGMTIDSARAQVRPQSQINSAGDTVYICAADGEGNVVSLISSLYSGCGVVAGATGIHFNNRGACFVLEEGHPNCLAPGKRPFHTLIPGFALKSGAPYAAFGVMGGRHQAQGHVQVLVNLLLHGLGLQESVSAPRFDYRQDNLLALEADFPADLRAQLAALGHKIVENDAGPFGGAQALRVLPDGVLEGASDPRKDGQAVGR